MSRYIGPVCRQCRREGIKLFLKGERCYTEKCSFTRRPRIPGMHHAKRGKKISEYGRQLREKQKAKRIYGVMERQFRKYFEMASRKKGETGENLLKILERRLDNVIYKCGFAISRRQARQLVRHGKVMVNGKVVDIPSYLVKPGERITLEEKALNLDLVQQALHNAQKKKSIPSWLDMNFDKNEVVVKNEPQRIDISIPVQEQLIVELYSK